MNVVVALDWTPRRSRAGSMQSWLTRQIRPGGFSRFRVYVAGRSRVELYVDNNGLIELRDEHGATLYHQQVPKEVSP